MNNSSLRVNLVLNCNSTHLMSKMSKGGGNNALNTGDSTSCRQQ
ncbi:MAG TPA: hypothetical protein VJ729_18465 [Nitrososphaeraceae archaeon]|nr:hypothetical protein [Nitrososphaeraceae archaeon]